MEVGDGSEAVNCSYRKSEGLYSPLGVKLQVTCRSGKVQDADSTLHICLNAKG